jgi:hypothetical protein
MKPTEKDVAHGLMLARRHDFLTEDEFAFEIGSALAAERVAAATHFLESRDVEHYTARRRVQAVIDGTAKGAWVVWVRAILNEGVAL